MSVPRAVDAVVPPSDYRERERGGLHAAELTGAGDHSLRSRTIRATAWTIAGDGVGQALRLAGNLVLTRLLFPEAFGLMALVYIVLTAVQQFSDVGLRGSIVHHRRGDDPAFLNTAWTLQVVRGVVLWAALCLAAWPTAVFYGEPGLAWMIPVVGCGAIFEGFVSTTQHTLIRHVLPGRRVAMEIGSQVLALIAMVAWAYVHRSVWALVVGDLVGAASRMVISHFLIAGYSNRFAFDRDALRSQLRFGRWILLATAFTFVLVQGDRVILGKMLTAGEMGVYFIAVSLSQAVVLSLQRLSLNVLFPVYASLAKRGTEALQRQMARVRLVLLAITLPPVWVLAVAGRQIVAVLYDDRYHAAGWMLEILAVGVVGSCVTISGERILLALGNSFRHMLLHAARALLLIAGMTIGGVLAGVPGLLVGVSVARLGAYVPFAVLIRRYGVWQPGLDGAAFAASALAVGGGWYLLR